MCGVGDFLDQLLYSFFRSGSTSKISSSNSVQRKVEKKLRFYASEFVFNITIFTKRSVFHKLSHLSIFIFLDLIVFPSLFVCLEPSINAINFDPAIGITYVCELLGIVMLSMIV